MITLNGKKFAENENEFKNSLFASGGTCSGYYKRLKNKVKLFNIQMELIGVITKYKVLAKATKLENGSYWYSYGDIDIIGAYTNESRRYADIDAILEYKKELQLWIKR